MYAQDRYGTYARAMEVHMEQCAACAEHFRLVLVSESDPWDVPPHVKSLPWGMYELGRFHKRHRDTCTVS